MVIEKTPLGCFKISPTLLEDSRGLFFESYRADLLREHGINDVFVQDNHSLSKKSETIRGLHYQSTPFAQSKLVRVINGAILDVIVDIDPHSSSYGKHETFFLSAENHQQLYIPPHCAHGFKTLKENTEVVYKTSNYYSPSHEHGYLWNSPELSINWDLSDSPTLSAKDMDSPPFQIHR